MDNTITNLLFRLRWPGRTTYFPLITGGRFLFSFEVAKREGETWQTLCGNHHDINQLYADVEEKLRKAISRGESRMPINQREAVVELVEAVEELPSTLDLINTEWIERLRRSIHKAKEAFGIESEDCNG